MFERNRIDNSLQLTGVAAEIALDDGQVLKGKFLISASRSIFEVLNGESAFIEFETYGGERRFIAKAAMRSVKAVAVPSAAAFHNRMREPDTFDPHAVLGVNRAADFDEVRTAYLKHSKAYHPDRFAGVELPAEVRDYLSIMSRRINAAFSALETASRAEKRIEIEKAKPVYTSPARA